jgi:hypothetical protein
MNWRWKTLWEKGEGYQSNVEDVNNITCTKISPHRKDKMRTLHNIQEATIVEDMRINIPRLYASLENR